MVLDAQESNPFLDRLAAMTPDEWASIGSASAAWDAAWDRALAAGALDLALPAMAVARASGASLGRAALAGAAAAALELEDLLRPEDFEALYAPFAPIVVRAERRLPAWGRTGAA